MICIILVAGHGTQLENEIKESSEHEHLVGIPKALLPGVGGKRLLDFWWEAIKTRQLFSEVYLVTNADKYKHYERWATASDFPVENIINDGTTTYANRLGSVADFDLVLRTKNIKDDVMVVAGDMLFQDHKFDISQVLKYFKLKESTGDLAIYYEMESEETTASRGIVEVDPTSHRITKFYEKPSPRDTASRLASVVFYCFCKATLATFPIYLASHIQLGDRNFGKYLEWHINEKNRVVYGIKLPTGFQLIGNVGLADYERWLAYFSSQENQFTKLEPIVKRAYARNSVLENQVILQCRRMIQVKSFF